MEIANSIQFKDSQKNNVYPVCNLDATVIDGSETKTFRMIIEELQSKITKLEKKIKTLEKSK